MRPLTDRLIVVFGAGGLRDAGRRPLMGGIVAAVADYAIITTDNPRTEDAAVIASQIASGINVGAKAEVFTELDRTKAIQKAYALSMPGSFIMLLGKGVEQYQIIGTQKIPFRTSDHSKPAVNVADSKHCSFNFFAKINRIDSK